MTSGKVPTFPTRKKRLTFFISFVEALLSTPSSSYSVLSSILLNKEYYIETKYRTHVSLTRVCHKKRCRKLLIDQGQQYGLQRSLAAVPYRKDSNNIDRPKIPNQLNVFFAWSVR